MIDEPSIGLAPKIAEEVYGWVDLFAAEQMAILLVDHNVRRVIRMSNHVYVVSLGQIAAEGSPDVLLDDLHEQVKGWLGINFQPLADCRRDHVVHCRAHSEERRRKLKKTTGRW